MSQDNDKKQSLDESVRVLTDTEIFEKFKTEINSLLQSHVKQQVDAVNLRVNKIEDAQSTQQQANERRFAAIERSQQQIASAQRQMTETLGIIGSQTIDNNQALSTTQDAITNLKSLVEELRNANANAFKQLRDRDEIYGENMTLIQNQIGNIQETASRSSEVSQRTAADVQDLRARMSEVITPMHAFLFGNDHVEGLQVKMDRQEAALREEISAIRADFKPIVTWVTTAQKNLSRTWKFATSRLGIVLTGTLIGPVLIETPVGQFLETIIKLLLEGLL